MSNIRGLDSDKEYEDEERIEENRRHKECICEASTFKGQFANRVFQSIFQGDNRKAFVSSVKPFRRILVF